MEDTDLTAEELKYKNLIRKMKERIKWHDEHRSLQQRRGGFIFADKSMILTYSIVAVIISTFIICMLIISPKTVLNICLIVGLLVIVATIFIIKISNDIKNWLFISKYEKKVADSYIFIDEHNSEGELEYYIEFTVSSKIMDPVTHKCKLHYNTVEKIKALGYLPVVLKLGPDIYDYDIDFNKINKLIIDSINEN